ncbi:MAG: NAD(+)/NADH kinase [Oscillospiraceae bacterium]|nr:NAD(+)/NADH kinase [Oscillospiraceae bacterium]
MKKVVLCTNPTKDKNYELTRRVYAMLEGKAERVVAPILSRAGAGFPHELRSERIEDAMKGAQLAVCFGGDGTLLKTARYASEYDIPILSINLGRRGFLTELESVEEEYVLRALEGDFLCDSRMMLDVSLTRGGEVIHSDCALNDAVISKGGEARSIDLTVKGDGVVISELYVHYCYSLSIASLLSSVKSHCPFVT